VESLSRCWCGPASDPEQPLGLSKVHAAKSSSQYLGLWHYLGAAAGQ